MKHKLNYILMADIIGSRKINQQQLMLEFKGIVNETNLQLKKNIRSPMTITLGDEFQGVVATLYAGIEVIIKLEELILIKGLNFKLRYVLVEGEIETPVNSEIAYEMLGDGLTQARETLNALKSTKNRYLVKINNGRLGDAINHTFIAFQGIVDGWKLKQDYFIAARFIEKKDYKTIANEVKRDKSIIWKRKVSLKIKEYLSLKEVLTYLSKTYK